MRIWIIHRVKAQEKLHPQCNKWLPPSLHADAVVTLQCLDGWGYGFMFILCCYKCRNLPSSAKYPGIQMIFFGHVQPILCYEWTQIWAVVALTHLAIPSLIKLMILNDLRFSTLQFVLLSEMDRIHLAVGFVGSSEESVGWDRLIIWRVDGQ